MAIQRPTFHEAWYRVANLRPRLLPYVRVSKQHYRGQLWYVIDNSTSGQYCRVGKEACWLIGWLDGRRSVSEAWRMCNQQFGDSALTQGEVIQLLGQLHSLNLLHTDLPPNAEALFNRYRKRTRRRLQNRLTNILFIYLPLVDPDRFLDNWVSLFGHVFTWLGLAIWTILIAAGLSVALGNLQGLVHESNRILVGENLLWLYLSLAGVKIIHEFSHAFACKRFGRLSQTGGEVHGMGVMFLVFFPLPYLDASSAWAFRSKWRRAMVGAAGVMAELAMAAVAAIVWANTSPGTLHAVAYNVMFVASVSTILFNGNPLLRFDAYYVLSDLIEIPNLAQRSTSYLYYLVKRYAWGVKELRSPAKGMGERIWFVAYGTASTVYRLFISIRILLFLNDRLPEPLFILVPMFAMAAIGGWVLLPLGRFVHYLLVGAELERHRLRAFASVLTLAGILVASIGVVKVPDYHRIEGVVEPVAYSVVRAGADGFIADFAASGTQVSPGDSPLLQERNVELELQRKIAVTDRNVLELRRRQALLGERARVQVLDNQLDALDKKLAKIDTDIASLRIVPPISGTWVAPDIDRLTGAFVRRGQPIGTLLTLDESIIRATAGQGLVATLIEQSDKEVQMRVRGNPHLQMTGQIEKIFPAGQEILPSEALGYLAGGTISTTSLDPNQLKTAERFFEIRIRPERDETVRLFSGQRIIARIRMHPKPLAHKWWLAARQLFQRRFRI